MTLNGVSDDTSTPSDLSAEHQSSELPAVAPTSVPRTPQNSGLNHALTFDRFVVGESNKKACEAAIAVSNQAMHVDKLIVHGGVGLGKTHLLHAIGNQFHQKNLNHTTYCPSAEKFMGEWIQSIANPQKSNALRQRYHTIDLLLIDDIHFLSKNTKVQEEFVHLLNHLSRQNQRIVCTCDRLPQFLKDFLASSNVLKNGLIVEISPPEFELRVSILKRKLRERNFGPVPLRVLNYLAKHLTQHVRQLEGVLNRLMAEVRLGSNLNLEIARRVVEKRSNLNLSGTITLETIQEAVARYFHLTLSDLCSRKRGRRFVLPRQVGMYLTRELTALSLSQISQGFGQSHHTIVVRSYQRIESLLKVDLVLSQSIETLKTELTQPQK
jgi:chromosomal replication initiator protein